MIEDAELTDQERAELAAIQAADEAGAEDRAVLQWWSAWYDRVFDRLVLGSED